MELNEIPKLIDWDMEQHKQYFSILGENVIVDFYSRGLNENNKLGILVINKTHYRDRMPDICKVINYYENYFDPENELITKYLVVKHIIDRNPNFKKKAFINLVISEIVTSSFISNIKKMTDYLYELDIDSDSDGKYRSTPKISNIQAKLLVALSFAIRCVLPICIHFSDTNNNFPTNKAYIKVFDKIIVKILHLFEENDVEVFDTICRFTKYRIDNAWNSDGSICKKKKQIHGITKELYLEEVIHEVVLVKSLYKLDYWKSIVSFIDGVIFLYHNNFKIENFRFKPIEIEIPDNDDDSDKLSYIESIDNQVYQVDESNPIISEVNIKNVLKDIRRRFGALIPDEAEIDFYEKNMIISPVSKMLFEPYYNKFFNDHNAVLNTDRRTTIELIIYMKKFLQINSFTILPQILTAIVRGKYKENTIKNSKFIDKIKTSDSWNNIIESKFSYIREIAPDDDLIVKIFSILVNVEYEFIDFNGPDNRLIYDNPDQDRLISELERFLTIL